MPLLLGCAALLWAFSASLALFLFETWRGRALGFWFLLALWSVLALVYRAMLGRWLLLGCAVGALVLLWLSPGSPSRPRGASGQNWPWWDPLNLIPESDLVKSGIKFLFPAVKGEVILPLLTALYREMDEQPEYQRLRHVIWHTGTDLLGSRTAAGHYYSYVPANVARPPVLVFLHGAMGNYQCFLYFWQKWAERRGFAVICPTFGYGNWYRPGGAEAAEHALLHALENLPLDPQRVLLTGLSNGSTGAVRLVRRQGRRIRGLVLFSPVIEVEQYASAEFREWAGEHAPMLVLQGDRDSVVQLATVQHRLQRLRQLGVSSDLQVVNGKDHYMMFAAAEQVYAALDQAIAGWDTTEPRKH